MEKAQYLLQLLAGDDMNPSEYVDKLEIVRDQLLVVYSMGYQKSVSEDVFRKETVVPPTAAIEDWDSLE